MRIETFIAARLAEEKRDALAAGKPGRQWRTEEWHMFPQDSADENPRLIIDDVGGHPFSHWVLRPAAEHAVRQDPAATLARVDALEALAAEHGTETLNGVAYCTACGDCPQVKHPCTSLRHVAAIWRHHPDYRQEWSP